MIYGGNDEIGKEAKVRTNLLSKFYPAIFVTVAVLVAASLLTLTENFTWTELKAQRDQQTLDMLKGIFPEASFYVIEEDDIYIIYDDSRYEIGYAFYAKGMGVGGFLGGEDLGEKIAGPIVILVGLEDKETIKGIFVVSHSESPQYWVSLIETNYFDQFIGLKIKDAYFTRDGGQVDAITGATLSSTLVLNTVRETALEKVESID